MKRILLVSIGTVVVLGLLLAFTPVMRHWVMNNVGRYHIVLLHFPVGLLMMAFLMEMARLTGFKKLSPDAIQFVLGAGTASAILAASTGWVLQFEGGYEPELLEWHERLGIITALLAIATFALNHFQKQKLYLASLALTSIMVTLAGHMGGSLTHGEDFLTENLGNTSPRSSQTTSATDYEQAQVFSDLIHPILMGKCASCHNTNKQKGGLSLVDSLGVFAGGEHGSILQPGKNGISELVRLITLDLNDDDHMPPKGKAPLSQEDIALITWWVDQGAPISNRIASIPQPEGIAESIGKRFTPVHPLDLLGISRADPGTLVELRNSGFRIAQLDPEKPWLSVNFSDDKELSVERLEELDPVQEKITELDLGNTHLTPDHLAWVNELEHLLLLKLDNTNLNEKALAELSDLAYLEVLNVYGTELGDLKEAPATAFPALKKLYAWEAGIPATTLEAWQTVQPQLQLEGSHDNDMFPTQAIIAPEFSTTSPFFSEKLSLALFCDYPKVAIHYTLDGSTPGPTSPQFQDTFALEETATLKALALLEGWDPSPVVEQTFLKVLPAVTYRLPKAPDEKYPGNHPQCLIDQKTGEATFNDEAWMGYWGRDCRIILELAQADTVNGIAVHALEDVNSWVLFPQNITVKGGSSPSNLKHLASKTFDLTKENLDGKTALMQVSTPPSYIRYLQIEVKNFGKLPDWHQSAGQDAWLFLDEVGVY